MINDREDCILSCRVSRAKLQYRVRLIACTGLAYSKAARSVLFKFVIGVPVDRILNKILFTDVHFRNIRNEPFLTTGTFC